MDIGPEKDPIIIEPIPSKVPAPVPEREPAPVKVPDEPEKVPA